MRCQCLRCDHHESPCENHEGQLDLFSDGVITLVEYQGQNLCLRCLPKPPAKPRGDYYYNKREDKRLSKQDTLFLFL